MSDIPDDSFARGVAAGRYSEAMGQSNEIARLTRERDELRGPIRFILQRNRDILGGLCDDAIDGIEVQSEELTDALTKLREWLSNTEKETG